MEQYINESRQKSKRRITVRQYIIFLKVVRSQQIKTFKNYIQLHIVMET